LEQAYERIEGCVGQLQELELSGVSEKQYARRRRELLRELLALQEEVKGAVGASEDPTA
jgi:hypothetical protein